MSEHCPLDGAFVGRDGCTHKNHTAPRKVTAAEGRAILAKHPEVTDPDGQRVRFGERLEGHLAGKSPEEQNRRLEKMDYALNAVRTTKPILHPRGMADRNLYVKPTSEKTSVMVFVDNSGEVQEVFDVYSKATKDVQKSLKTKASVPAARPAHRPVSFSACPHENRSIPSKVHRAAQPREELTESTCAPTSPFRHVPIVSHN